MFVSYTKSLSAASNPPSVDCFSAPATELLEMVEDLYNKYKQVFFCTVIKSFISILYPVECDLAPEYF